MNSSEWLEASDEGQLAIDVFRDGDRMVVRSTVAGVKPEDLDISVHGDLLTIRGKRQMARDIKDEDWYYRECYWGSFSRSVVLPFDVAADQAEASIKNGVLEVAIPIRDRRRRLEVKVLDENAR